ncbi:hypothetical protein [Jeotgalicoccus sp. S0W5]|uniref:hypothetical protein n=1 Tax=Jeotgalicoccus sp. S0W5 TaxID=2527874 RepID=UPI00141507E2|nr:hypothetical protein [Jeotgalicoccus sp. S0W5]
MLSSNFNYPYGFVFADKEYDNIPSYYSKKIIFNKYVYSYDDRETPQILIKESNFIILHGNFVHVGKDKNLTNIELSDFLLESYVSNKETFLDTLDFIGGRYVVIIGTDNNAEIYTDATAMRSVYYANDYNLVASHFNLLKDLIPTNPLDLGMKYATVSFTYDKSPAENIKSLMPNFKLNFNDKNISRFFPRQNNKYKEMPIDDKYLLFEKLWKDQINYCINTYDDIAFSLTGGNDSRISLAMLKDHKDKIRMFTYAAVDKSEEVQNRTQASYDIDRVILEKMKANLDLNHEFYFFKNNKYHLSDDASKAVSKNVFRSHGKFLVPYYMQSFPKEKSLHIRANLLEIGRSYLISPTTENSIQSINDSYVLYVLGKYKGNTEDIDDLKEYANDMNEQYYSFEPFDYQLLDLAFWESRMGRWHAEIVNETDIAFQSYIPYNMRALIDISLSFPYETRKSIKFFRDLINRNYPVLNFFGYNRFDNLYEQMQSDGNTMRNPYTRFKDNIFNRYNLYDSDNNIIKEIINYNNTIYIDRHSLRKGNYSQLDLGFNKVQGHVHLALNNSYSSKNRGALSYSIYVNDTLYLEEDMSVWRHNNDITIFNLKSGDKISIIVSISKNLKGVSWESASKLILKSYEEYQSKQKISKKIAVTSPASKIHV